MEKKETDTKVQTSSVLKTVEEWREEKLPVVYFVGRSELLTGKPSIDFTKDKSWLYESAKSLHEWANGEVISEEDFIAAIEKAGKHCPRK